LDLPYAGTRHHSLSGNIDKCASLYFHKVPVKVPKFRSIIHNQDSEDMRREMEKDARVEACGRM
jgi:hypothetical protein